MPKPSLSQFTSCGIRLFVTLFLCALTSDGRGDVIQLRNGGEIRGEIDRQSVRDGGPLTITTLSGSEIVVERDAFTQYAFRPVRIEEFESRLRRIEPSVEAYWELVEWCAQQRMTPQRNECLERIIELNPNHAEARRLLDHVEFKGEWMTREEMMRERGFVKYRNRYITEQELALIEKTQSEREQEREWQNRIRQWSGWLYGSHPARAEEALLSLQNLKEPAAITGLVNVFQNHPDKQGRQLLVQVLSQMDHTATIGPLAAQAVFDSDPEIRYLAANSIPERFHPTASERIALNLRHKDNAIVRRAAEALKVVGGEASIDDLIDALVTQHTVTVHVPVQEAFTLNTNTGNLASAQPVIPPNVELMYRAGQLPYGYQVAQPPVVKTRAVKYQVAASNEEALVALQMLTGENFGFDERSWRIWFASRKNQSPALSNTAPPG